MVDANQTIHYAPAPAVQQAVQDAQRLLMCAVQSRLSIDHDIVKTLTKAKNVLRQNVWTPEEEIALRRNLKMVLERPLKKLHLLKKRGNFSTSKFRQRI